VKQPRKTRYTTPVRAYPDRRVTADPVLAGSRQGLPCYLAWTENGDLAGRIVVRTERQPDGGTGASLPRYEAQRYTGNPVSWWTWGEGTFGQGFVPGPTVESIQAAEQILNAERTTYGQP
jgi:hypothetical protein